MVSARHDPAGPARAAAPIVRALDAAGYRLTGTRRTVAELIAARSGHFSAAELIDDARERRLGVGRATIFRALDLLTELELLERLELPDGSHAYVPCLPRRHHHHIVCSGCGQVTDAEDLGLAAALEETERRTGWRIESHRLELYGRCPRCGDPRPDQAA